MINPFVALKLYFMGMSDFNKAIQGNSITRDFTGWRATYYNKGVRKAQYKLTGYN